MKLGDSLGRSRRRRRNSESSVDEGLAEGRDDGRGPPSDPQGRGLLASVSVPHLLGAAVGLALGGWLFGYGVATRVLFPAPPPPGDLFEVPDLRGLGLASATERLAGMGLQLGAVDSLRHPTVGPGLILGQSPLPGQLSRPATPLRVTVSTGSERRAVPDVVSLDAGRARTVLEASGFVVREDSTVHASPRGRVVRVTPSVDSMVPVPSEVFLLVSAGPPVVAMPLVLGLERAAAEALIDSLGLVVTEVEEVFRFGRDQGIVVEQEPAADTELERGSAVRLKVGRQGRDEGRRRNR